MHKSIEQVSITKMAINTASDVLDDIAIEEPLEIQILYGGAGKRIQKTISVTMRTPGNDDELATGFLFTEGIIQSREQVADVSPVPFTQNQVLVTLQEDVHPTLQQAERNFYTTSSCGVCGKASIDAIKTVSVYQNLTSNVGITPDVLYRLPQALAKQQPVFQSTGGLHASALFNAAGNCLMLREDVGRHNALDKVIGAAFLQGLLPLNNAILLLSGRASFELIQKAAMAGIRMVAAVGAPSSLAVELAKETGITLVGFLRNNRFNIYVDAANRIINL